MAIADLDQFKIYARIDSSDDDDDIERLLDAAQNQIESWLGFRIASRYTDSPPSIPAELVQAVLALTAHWYANREAVVVGSSIVTAPLSVRDSIAAHRDYFGAGFVL